MRAQKVRIALYLNQFFGQVGGEEKAATPPMLREEPVGPGRALAAILRDTEMLVGTVICGDNTIAEQENEAVAKVLELLRLVAPDLMLAGPAFNAGRYGQACGAVCKAVQQQLGIPAITAMYKENPGVEMYRKDVYIVETGGNAAGMRDALAKMLVLGRTLVEGGTVGRPQEASYFPRGRLVQEIVDKPAAERAVDMLLAKLAGKPFRSEVPLPSFKPVDPPPPVPDPARATVALVTDGGLVPAGNPDKIEGFAATRWGAYPIAEKESLDPEDYDISHGGYDDRYVKEDPNRLLPLDVAREFEKEGKIGRLHERFLSTSGLANPIENSRRMGREMAEHLIEVGVNAVILTST